MSLPARILRFVLKLAAALVLLSVLWVVLLKWVPVWVTPLMVQRSFQFRGDGDFHTQSRWRSLDEISP